MEYSALTKEEKQDIFEIVNSTHLHLKGNQKKLLKSTFCNVWKINKNMGAFELFMKLYESENVYDKMNTAFLEYVKDGYDNEYYTNHKHIPYAKHIQRMQWRNEEVEEAERQLEEIKESKGYISREDHNTLVDEMKKNHDQLMMEKEDTIIKLRNLENGLRLKLDAANERFDGMRAFYEDQMKKLTNDES